jgi:hypothetical protein
MTSKLAKRYLGFVLILSSFLAGRLKEKRPEISQTVHGFEMAAWQSLPVLPAEDP